MSGIEARRAQAIKDYKLTVEYKHLKQNSPGGIYVVPSFADLRTWHGVIFVRRGMYASGVFKFRVELPPEYNDVGVARLLHEPHLQPLVDAESGELDVKFAYPEWDPAKHYVVTVLTFLKKIFYIKDGFEGYEAPKNAAAARAYADDAPEFLREVEACVRARPRRSTATRRRPDRSLRFVDRDDGALDAFRGVLAGDDDDVDGPGTGDPPRQPNELSGYQRKLLKIDEHMTIAVAGLNADARTLAKTMRTECLNHRYVYGAPLQGARLVLDIADKYQRCTQMYQPPPVAALATADATTAGEAATPFRVGAYSEGYGRLNTSYYPFLFGKADAVLVEPHRDYVLRIEGGGAGATYAWSGVASGAGPDLNVRFNKTGIYRFLTVAETGALGVASALNVTLYVKYVSTADGVEIYGDRYKDIHHVAVIHNDLAGNNMCDFIHGATGYAFVTAHAALGGMVEQAMQAVDPSVSMPYWDYTLDKWLYTDRARPAQVARVPRFIATWESPVWTADFFGASDEDTGVIVDGAWAHTKVPLLSERLFNDSGFAGHFRTNGFASCYGQTDDVCTYPALSLLRQKKASTMHQGNAFGLLRSPWNQRGEPTVVRSRKMCGSANNAQFPDCVAWAQQQGMYTSFADYMIQLQVAKYDELGKIVIDHHYLDQIKDKSSDLQKNLWMGGAKSCPSRGECAGLRQKECGCRCHGLGALQAGYDNSTLNAQDIADSKLWKQVVAGAFDGFREADRARAKLDLLGAPELRLLRTHVALRPGQRHVPGQHPSYKLVWFDYELDSDDVGDDLEATLDSSTLSNVVWRDLLDPRTRYARVPYVYHDFEWEHCLHYSVEGVDASLMRPNDWIWNKRDDREESRGAIPNAHAHSDLGNVTRVQPNSHSPPAVTDDDYKEAY
ncbi:hypothetical protein JL720_14642 [Aureococcus anophagefferens]|nr:hypothetical protein JL720_14642 [Aureococcus anophagefferens]